MFQIVTPNGTAYDAGPPVQIETGMLSDHDVVYDPVSGNAAFFASHENIKGAYDLSVWWHPVEAVPLAGVPGVL